MKVLGLDVSFSCTGIARPDGTTRVLVPPKELGGIRRIAWVRGLVALELQDVDVVVIEGFSYGSDGQSFIDLAQLGGVLRFTMFDAGIPFAEVAPGSLKKYATGSGDQKKIKKPQMLEAAHRILGYKGSIHDEADALWLREMGMDWYGVRPVPSVAPLNREALHAVKWPHIPSAPRFNRAAMV